MVVLDAPKTKTPSRLRLGLLTGPLFPLLLLGLIIILAAVLRFYRLADFSIFMADQSRDVMLVQQMIDTGEPLLLGPRASVGDYYRGPAYYYLALIPLLLSQGHPISVGALIALVDVGTVLLLFVVGRSFFTVWVGLAAAALWAAHPWLAVVMKTAWNPHLLPFLTLLILYSLHQIASGRERYLVLLVLSWSVAWQLHDQALLLLPLCAAFAVVFRPRIALSTYLAAGGAALLSLAPFLLYEVQHQFHNLRSMLGYALHLPQSSQGAGFVSTSRYRLAEMFRVLDWFPPGSGYVHLLFVLLACLGMLVLLLRMRTAARPKSALIFMMYSFTPFLYVFWPSQFLPHYLMILFPIPALLIGLGLDALRLIHNSLRIVAWICVVAVLAVNSYDILASLRNNPPGPGTYRATANVVDYVISNARGQPLDLRIVSPHAGLDDTNGPYHYIMRRERHHVIAQSDENTFVVYHPHDFREGASRKGVVINGIKVVRSGPTRLGPSILRNGEFTRSTAGDMDGWYIPNPGAARIEGGLDGNALVLTSAEVGDRINAIQEIDVEPSRSYVVTFEYRNRLSAEKQRVYLQVLDSVGNVLETFPDGGGYVATDTDQWTRGSFTFYVADTGARAVLWLRNRGTGEAWFRNIAVREAIQGDSP